MLAGIRTANFQIGAVGPIAARQGGEVENGVGLVHGGLNGVSVFGHSVSFRGLRLRCAWLLVLVLVLVRAALSERQGRAWPVPRSPCAAFRPCIALISRRARSAAGTP